MYHLQEPYQIGKNVLNFCVSWVLTHNEIHEEQHRGVQRDMDLQCISQDLDILFPQQCTVNYVKMVEKMPVYLIINLSLM